MACHPASSKGRLLMNVAKRQLSGERANVASNSGRHITEDEFLSFEDLVPLKRDAAERTLRQVLAEMEEVIREKRWQDATDIF